VAEIRRRLPRNRRRALDIPTARRYLDSIEVPAGTTMGEAVSLALMEDATQ